MEQIEPGRNRKVLIFKVKISSRHQLIVILEIADLEIIYMNEKSYK